MGFTKLVIITDECHKQWEAFVIRAKAYAKKLWIRGTVLYPCFLTQSTHDVNWIKKKYLIDDVLDDSNVGINLGQSNLIDVDLDCALAVHFGRLWLPYNTLKLARITKMLKR